MKTKLKPCPFCGKEAQATTGYSDYSWYVNCFTDYCHASVPPDEHHCYEREELAVAAWNTRANVE